MKHIGKPKWNGVEKDVDLQGCLIPCHETLGPILMQIENCEDFFCPIFSTKEKLQDHMTYINISSYKIKKVDDPKDFFDSLREHNVRVMHDPQVINEHHTKWNEVIYDGEQWKFGTNK